MPPDTEKLVCMAMDAFRLCVGLLPRNFTPQQIADFIANRARPVATDVCPSCRRVFPNGGTCHMGGCPMGGDF